MKRFFKWLLLVLALTTVAAVVVVNNLDLIKEPLERRLSKVAGYSISLKGDLDLDIGRQTVLTAKNIHISAPEWARHQELVGIGHLKVVLLTSTLFENVLVLESLQVDGVELNLETDAEGGGNWITANKPSPPGEEEGRDSVILFKNIKVTNTSIRYRNGEKDIEHLLSIVSLTQNRDADDMLHATLSGEFNDRLINGSGSIGPYANLLDGHDVSFNVGGKIGDLEINGSGLIDDLLQPERPSFSLDILGPDIDEITRMLGVDDLGSGAFNLRAKGAEVAGSYEADINGKVGDVSINASLQASNLSQFSDPSQFNEFDLMLAINGPSLGAFTRVFGLEDWPDKPFSLRGGAERIGGTLDVRELTLSIGGTQFLLDALLTNFPEFDASRIKLSVKGDDIVQFRELLGFPGLASGPFEINGKLDVTPEEVEMLQVDMATSLGQATLSGTLGDGPGFIGSKGQFHLEGVNAHSFISVIGIDALPEQPFTLNTRLELVDNGLQVEEGVLLTIEDDRLEAGGLIAFNPGIAGSDLDLRVSGNDLAQMLGRLGGTTTVPAKPYDLTARFKVLDNALQLESANLDFSGIKLGAQGSVIFADQLLGTVLDFQINGDDFSAWRVFEAVGDSLDIFVPGQPYQASGRVTSGSSGWQLNDIKGKLGKTNLDFNARIGTPPDWAGTQVSFSIQGPGLDQLLLDQDQLKLPVGAYKSSGQIFLTADRLKLDKLNFETDRAHARVDLDLGWPFGESIDARFDVDVRGSDIRNLLPKTGSFEPDPAAFNLRATGHKRGELISLKQFNGKIGDLQILLIGEIGYDTTKDSADVAFSIVSKDISKLGQYKGEPLPALALDLKTDLKVNTGQYVFHNMIVSLGDSHLEGLLDVRLDGPKPQIKLEANSKYVDLSPFLKNDDTEDDQIEVADSGDQERLIPATPLPLDALAKADIDIKLNIEELRHLEDSVRKLVLDTKVEAGGLNVSDFSFEAPMGKFRTSLSILPTNDDYADVNFDLDAEGLVLNISGQPRDKLQQVPPVNMDVQITGHGKNLQDVAGSLNGHYYLESSGGTLEGVNLSILDTFILDELFGLILPKSPGHDNLNLTCLASMMNIKDGQVRTEPAMAFRTDRIEVVAKGTMDLKTEKLKFNFNATPTNALKISAGELFNPYILVGGTLSEPEVGIDPSKALLHGGAAIGTAGISILAKGVLDRVGTAIHLCEEMRQKIQLQKQQG
jgi:uncharacterized protein involved in outer membrane biogenesis